MNDQTVGVVSPSGRGKKRPKPQSSRRNTARDAKQLENRSPDDPIIRRPNLVPSPHLPSFCILPRDISRVVHVQQQALAAVEKSEPEKVVVDESKKWAKNNGIDAELP